MAKRATSRKSSLRRNDRRAPARISRPARGTAARKVHPTAAQRPKKRLAGSVRGRPAAKRSTAAKAPLLKSPRVSRKPKGKGSGRRMPAGELRVGRSVPTRGRGPAKAQKLLGIGVKRSAPKEPAGKVTTARKFTKAPVGLAKPKETPRNATRATPQIMNALPELDVPKMPRPGELAPDFALPDSEGNIVRLSELRGKRVVLYFYPRDDTPGCALEAQGFRDDYEEFQDRDVLVYGISKDDAESHKEFMDKYDLNFPLLSDETGETIKDYGCWVEKNLYGRRVMGTARASFLIDEHGRVEKVWPKVTPEGHSKEILEAL